jgi:hypothetical protein
MQVGIINGILQLTTGSYGNGTKASWESSQIAGILLSQLLAVVCHHHGCANKHNGWSYISFPLIGQSYYSCLVLFKALGVCSSACLVCFHSPSACLVCFLWPKQVSVCEDCLMRSYLDGKEPRVC